MSLLAAAATGVQVLGQAWEARDAQQAAKRAASAEEENARLASLAGEQQALSTRREAAQIMGEALAAQAGSGFTPGTGTAADIVRQSALAREEEVLAVRMQAADQAMQHRQQAAEHRRAGRAALIRGAFNIAGTLVSAASGQQNQRRLDQQQQRERAALAPRRALTTTRTVPWAPRRIGPPGD